MPRAKNVLPTSAEAQVAVSNETASRFLKGRQPLWLIGGGVSSTSRSGKKDREPDGSSQANPPEKLVPPKVRLAEVIQQTSPPSVSGECFPDARPVSHQNDTIAVATSDNDTLFPSPAPSDDGDKNEQQSVDSLTETTGRPGPGEHQPEASRYTGLNSAFRDAQSTTTIAENVARALQTELPETSVSPGLGLSWPNNARPAAPSQQVTRARLQDEQPDGPPTKRHCTEAARSFGLLDDTRVASVTKSDLVKRLKTRFHPVDSRENSSFTNLERDRYVFLQAAVERNDVFYYQLHQVFCRWSIDPSAAYQVLGIADDIDPGFQKLSQVLSDNSQISASHLNWLSSFPDNLINKPVLSQVACFLRCLGAKWDFIMEQVTERRYPMLISEVAQQLDAPSEMVQDLLFLFTMKRLVPTSATVAAASAIDELVRVHNQDRKNQTALPEAKPEMDAQIAQALKDCLSRYKAGGQVGIPGQVRPAGSGSGEAGRTSSPLVSQIAAPSVAPSTGRVAPQSGAQDDSISMQQNPQVLIDPSDSQTLWQTALTHQTMAAVSSVQPHRIVTNSPAGPFSHTGQQSLQVLNGNHVQQIEQPAGIYHAWPPVVANSGVAAHSPDVAQSSSLDSQMMIPSLQTCSPVEAQTPQDSSSWVTPAQQFNSLLGSEIPQMHSSMAMQAPLFGFPIVSEATQVQSRQTSAQQFPSPVPRNLDHSSQPSHQLFQDVRSMPLLSLNDYGSQQTPPAFARRQPLILYTSPPMSTAGDRTIPNGGNRSGHLPLGEPRFSGNVTNTVPFLQVSNRQQNPRHNNQSGFALNFSGNEARPVGDWQDQGQQMTPIPVPDYRRSQDQMTWPLSMMSASARPLSNQVQLSRQLGPAISHTNSRPLHPSMERAGYLVRELGYRIDSSQYQNNPYNKHALIQGLHQAHLRSPRRIPRVQTSTERYYQSIKHLAVRPEQVKPSPRMFALTFDVSSSEFSKIPGQGRLDSGRPYYEYFNGSLRYRMRLCKFPSDVQSVREKDWTTAATFWDPNLWLRFNSNTVTPCRKAFHGRDVPLELTSGVVEGQNILEAVVSWSNIFTEEAMVTCTLFMAVEVVETLKHSKIIEMVQSQELGPEMTKRAISNQITAGRLRSALDNDEIMVVDEDFSISIADPFSSKMFDIPVRGINCTHLDCFDLENWLITRSRKPECSHGIPLAKDCISCSLFEYQGEEPIVVDGWACPICGGDARPSQLRVDGFLVEVREQLLRKGKKNKKSIKVSADGSWKALPADEDEETDEEMAETPSPAKNKGKQKTEAPTPSRTQGAKHVRLPAQIPSNAIYIQLD